MSTSHSGHKSPDARAIGIIIGAEVFTICLSDGRQLSVPYHCFPRLDEATPQQRSHFEVSAGGRMIHWPEIDEDIEVRHVIEGRMPMKRAPVFASAVAEPQAKYGK